jgi:prepilin-type N-terminal cleavage/methylation domain-containing protein
MRHSSALRQGFTLVELLVVIAIIGILVALLLPAVQSAREAARRMQCQNNMKQLGLALHNYHDAVNTFPPSSIWNNPAQIETLNNANLGPNWVIMILPYMEQQGLYDSFNFTQGIPHANNMIPRSTRISSMLCPSDGFNNRPFNGTANSGTSNLGDNWARGNYGANACMGFMTRTQHGANSGATDSSESWKNPLRRGVMGANVSLSIGEIKDGTSNTILCAELRAGVVPFDSRGVWAMSGGCPSAMWAHGNVGDCNGPNAPHLNADDLLVCDAVRSQVGGGEKLQEMGMPCSAGSRPNYQQTARSQHAAGVYTVFGDGSVRFISDFINVTPVSGRISVWERLNASSDMQVLSATDF